MKKHLDIALVWFTAVTISSLPFLMCGMDFATAFLEASSALTSVGITSISSVESLYFYRAFLAFFGGFLFLICLPHLISTSDSFKFAIHENISIKILIKTYIYIFIIGIFLYLFFGENFSDSIVISALTVSTTGGIILPRNLMIPSGLLMFASIIFPLVCILIDFKFKKISIIKREQLRLFLFLFLLAFLYLILNKIPSNEAIFYIFSFASTTGFFLDDFYKINNTPLYVLFIFSLMGGLIGSVGGGIKLFRIIVLFKILYAELKHTLYPRTVLVIKLNNEPVPLKITGKVIIYFFLYTSTVFVFGLLLAAFGTEYENAAAIAFSFFTSVGILPSELKTLIFNFNPFLKIIMAFIFLIFRLKIFIFFIVMQYFCEQIFSLGVHSWKRK